MARYRSNFACEMRFYFVSRWKFRMLTRLQSKNRSSVLFFLQPWRSYCLATSEHARESHGNIDEGRGHWHHHCRLRKGPTARYSTPSYSILLPRSCSVQCQMRHRVSGFKMPVRNLTLYINVAVTHSLSNDNHNKTYNIEYLSHITIKRVKEHMEYVEKQSLLGTLLQF